LTRAPTIIAAVTGPAASIVASVVEAARRRDDDGCAGAGVPDIDPMPPSGRYEIQGTIYSYRPLPPSKRPDGKVVITLPDDAVGPWVETWRAD
jgi:hypothetical protein